jgi:hypothetical protein
MPRSPFTIEHYSLNVLCLLFTTNLNSFSRSSADDDGPQLLDDNVMSYADLDLVEDDDED